ncbi:MAG: nucleotidyltransferase domain-containing protein [Spirochaetota bacterium]
MTPEQAVGPIVERLSEMDVTRVIVFGSEASHAGGRDSDLDIAVVVPDPADSQSFNRTEAALHFRRRLRDINAKVPIDLIVYAESEFKEIGSHQSFLKTEIIERGRTVYERAG